MTLQTKLHAAQQALQEATLDGWLLYDFRRTNDLACDLLEIPPDCHLSRRFFYWIPKQGAPTLLCHAIETQPFSHLPGQQRLYCSWKELESSLQTLLQNAKCIAMEYSPRNAIPYISKVDGGTLELIRAMGVDVVSSADLLQPFQSLLTPDQLAMHRKAAAFLTDTAERTWNRIAERLKRNEPLTDYDVQQSILKMFDEAGYITECPPICASNADSANPHYGPHSSQRKLLMQGDFLLLDIACKQNHPHAIYADITQVAVAAPSPTERQKHIFATVRAARDAATELIRRRVFAQKPVHGYEVDQAARTIIERAGYGKFFIHRCGHSLGAHVHGNGANIDNLETQDQRKLLPGSCFTIEPGIYLPGEFGVRLEYDIYIGHDNQIEINGGIQKELKPLF